MIGYVWDGLQLVGIEGCFDLILGGEFGIQMMIKVDLWSDLWLLFDNLMEVEFCSGDDIVIIIDVNFQDIVEQVLLWGMCWYQLDWGMVIVMDVEIGVI